MKIEKAIETLVIENRRPWNHSGSDLRGAVKLGLEALKRIRDMRISPCTTSDEILAGETDD
ncbi:hypothetical protein LCGC14_0541460 [marine sediment metagenome]|uniref:Uncharacterized protein n=1 Tax=marine sediment metagenome TaxID=412755 RepID=A0A0F9SB83_9ZZZZ